MKDLPSEVTMSALREHLSSYLDAVASGRTITITRRGKPSAVLSAVPTIPAALEPNDLEAFRESLGVKLTENTVVSARHEERF